MTAGDDSADWVQFSPWPDADESHDLPWIRPERRGGEAYAQVLAVQRELDAALAGAVMPPDVAASVAATLADLSSIAGQYAVPESERGDGWRPDLPGRGCPLLPPFVIDEESTGSMRGRVRFSRFYLGGNNAAHGGALSLLFDDVLGRVANHGLLGVARTAFLHVDYRKIVPIDAVLTYEVVRERVEGRKRWSSGRLLDPSGAALTEAHGLFVTLLPGQP